MTDEQSLIPYLFVVDSSTMSRTDALEIIDQLPEVVNWQTILPDAAVLISPLRASDLHRVLHDKFQSKKYIITLLESGKKAGWLNRSAWEFMNHPKSADDV